jgi:branched-chain amino acid aminotransferase
MAGEGRVIKLQTPKYVYCRGRIRPWHEAVLHVSTEAVTRGLNVFEGIKGYWQPDGGFGLLALRRHYDRLRRSARLLHLPFDMEFPAFEHACHGLVQALYEPARDMWVRATLYGVEGHWGEGTAADLVLTAYHQPKAAPAPLDVGVSTWRRAADAALPCRIKTSTNYQVARLAKIEGRARGGGCGEMILLNGAGRVAEATGSCVLLVRDGRVITPPAWEGALESITVDIVAALCGALGLPFERRPVDRTELLIADELALAGTLVEISPVRSLDGRALPAEPKVVPALLARFRAAVTGVEPHPAVDLSCRPYAAHARIVAAE